MTFPYKIFSGSKMEDFTAKVCTMAKTNMGKLKVERFSDGEMSPTFLESIRGDYVFLVQSTNSPAENLLELLLMVDAAKRASAYKIIAVIPYFGYARQDRKDRPRVAIGAKLMASLFEASGIDRIITLDLHAPQIQGFFNIPVDHLDSSAVFIPEIEKLDLDNVIFASPDVGSTNRVRELASYFNAEMVICDKHRKRANEISSMVLIGDVAGKDVIIYDDICDTAGTLSKAAELLKENGAKSVRAYITHPVLSGKALENINKSCLDALFVTDSIPYTVTSNCSKIHVISSSHLFAKDIINAASNQSISGLFVHSRIKSK